MIDESAQTIRRDWSRIPVANTSALLSAVLSPVAAEALDDHVPVREMIDRVAQVSEKARERMDRLGESDAVSQVVLIDVVRKLDEQ